jgi:hypothetical protein
VVVQARNNLGSVDVKSQNRLRLASRTCKRYIHHNRLRRLDLSSTLSRRVECVIRLPARACRVYVT